MATAPLEMEAIKAYLISVGCKIEYPILVNAFKKHLYNPDPDVQGKVRTQFKDYVNRLATVSLENNMKFIQLRPEFRPPDLHQQPKGSRQPAIGQQQQQVPPMPPTPQTSDERQRAIVSGDRFPPVAMQEQRRPRSPDNGQQPSQPVRQQQQRQHQIPMQSPRLFPYDQTDSPLRMQQNNQQQLFQFPTNQIPSMQDQRQHQQPTSQYHNTAMIQMHARVGATQQSSSSRPTPKHANDNADQQRNLPPTMQVHSRSQSQPVSSQFPFQGPPAHSAPSYPQQQQQASHSPLAVIDHNVVKDNHLRDDSALLMPPPPPPSHNGTKSHDATSSPLRALRDQASFKKPDTPTVSRTTSTVSQQMPPPRPPPRRRQSTASLFKPNPSKPIEKMSREVSLDLARRSISGRVREHATRFNSSASTGDLSALVPKRNSSMKENRLSRESVFSGLTSALQRNGSQSRSRSSHRGEDESDSSSLQPIDPLRRKWAIEACSCNYNNLVSLLREDPKLASYKDIVNGYTALHWAAKFGNLDIIKLIAGTHQVSANIKSSAGQTPLHVAYMFNRIDAANLLTKSYRASQEVRDHSGKKPKFYLKES